MSKTINLKLFKTVTIALFFVALLSANRAVWGQTNPTPNSYVSLVYGLIDQFLPLPIGTHSEMMYIVGDLIGSKYDPAPNLPWPPNYHLTRAPYNRRIAHWAETRLVGNNAQSSPPTFTYPFAVPTTQNSADAANRLWDNAYNLWGYTKVNPTAGINTSMNCHGYSTGYLTWMALDPAVVQNISGYYASGDDYELTFSRDHLVPGTIFATTNTVPIYILMNGSNALYSSFTSHSSRVDTVDQIDGTHDLEVTVVEKFRVSALYEKKFTMTALCPNNDYLQCDGKCNMMNAPLPWSPIGFYRKKP